MPPQGESAGIALEDAIILGRALSKIHDSDLASCLAAYERLRRPRVDEAYRQASFGWDTLKDSGWFAFYLKSWLTSIFLRWTAQSRAINYSEDLSTADLNVLGG
jgi:salicylate hydroxylase